MAPAIPDRWLNYKPMGKQIEGTRFIAFKVPLRERVNEEVDEKHRLDANIVLKTIPNLGMIIDLTNTNRYYDPHSFEERGLEYSKIMIPGHQTPPSRLVRQFINKVITFLKNNSDNDKLIGVHCTHGVNRTGYLICKYMISELKMKPEEAINKFTLARGHKIERKNYLDALNEPTKDGIDKDTSVNDNSIVNNQQSIRSDETPLKEPVSWRAPPEAALAPTPQLFDSRDRFQRFRQEVSGKRQRFTSAAVAVVSRPPQQQLSNTAPSTRSSSSTNYSSRYVNTSRSGMQGNCRNSNVMHSNSNFAAHAPYNRSDDDKSHPRRTLSRNDIRSDGEVRYGNQSNWRI